MNGSFDVGYANFETGVESLTNEFLDRPETVEDNEIFRGKVEKNPDNTVTNYAEELSVCLTVISRHLKLIDKIKKKWINVFLMNLMGIINTSSSPPKLPFSQMNYNI